MLIVVGFFFGESAIVLILQMCVCVWGFGVEHLGIHTRLRNELSLKYI